MLEPVLWTGSALLPAVLYRLSIPYRCVPEFPAAIPNVLFPCRDTPLRYERPHLNHMKDFDELQIIHDTPIVRDRRPKQHKYHYG